MVTICIIGNSGTGKTAIFLKYFDGVFSDTYRPTVGIDYRAKYISKYHLNNRDGSSVLHVRDTSGNIVYRIAAISYYEAASGFLLIFSVTDRSSLENVKLFMGYIKNYNPKRPLIILVGNKCDLQNKREVSYEEAKKIADDWGIFYIETSAYTGFNIENTFWLLCETILNEFDWKYRDIIRSRNKALGI